jgi:tRNA (mo5U34)-methyltransferase
LFAALLALFLELIKATAFITVHLAFLFTTTFDQRQFFLRGCMTTSLTDNLSLRTQIDSNAEQQRNELASCSWWHSIDLGAAGITAGVHQLDELQHNFASFNLPEDMRGLRVLDIGCWDGFYAFEAERRGADVVAIDCWRPETFFAAKRALNSPIEFHELSIYEVSQARLGTFDIVLFLGVLYHLRHPLLALERVCEVTKDTAVIESHSIDHLLDTPRPILEFYETNELGGQYDNWWGPNTEALLRLARAAGFARTETIKTGGGRATIKARRGWEPAQLEASPSLQIREVVNAVMLDQKFATRGRFAVLSIFVEGLSATENIRVEIGGFGVTPAYVLPPDNQPRINNLTAPGLVVAPQLRAIASQCTQIITPMSPGLLAGTTPIRVLCGTQRSNDFAISLVDTNHSSLSELREINVHIND